MRAPPCCPTPVTAMRLTRCPARVLAPHHRHYVPPPWTGGPTAVHWRPAKLVGRKRVGRDDVRADSVWETVTSREEVRPMNVVSMWVLRLFFTVGRLT
jgi:hypothetical protein